jgi:hypothetical protein
MNRGRRALAGEETIAAGKGISGLGCCGAGGGALLGLMTRSGLVANCLEIEPWSEAAEARALDLRDVQFQEKALNWRRPKTGEHRIFWLIVNQSVMST